MPSHDQPKYMGPRYKIEFERIGRNKSVAAIEVCALGEADLARQIRTAARPHLRSADFDVMLDMDAGAGRFACGTHSGGNFSVTRLN